jgi:hypothetical protein
MNYDIDTGNTTLYKQGKTLQELLGETFKGVDKKRTLFNFQSLYSYSERCRFSGQALVRQDGYHCRWFGKAPK